MDPLRSFDHEGPRTRTNSFVRPRAALTSSARDQCNHTTCSTHRLGTYYTSSTLLKSTTREESGVRSTVHTTHVPLVTPDATHPSRIFRAAGSSTLRWWSWSGSNRRPTACKAAALPAELQPLFFVSCLELPKQTKKILVGLVGFEPTTPALSRRCSNQLSYRPSDTSS